MLLWLDFVPRLVLSAANAAAYPVRLYKNKPRLPYSALLNQDQDPR